MTNMIKVHGFLVCRRNKTLTLAYKHTQAHTHTLSLSHTNLHCELATVLQRLLPHLPLVEQLDHLDVERDLEVTVDLTIRIP